jgi:signal transduction histidine kinase/CheY-like chemotaxis protein
MTVDPQVLRSEQHVEVGKVIHRDAGLLIERWARRAAVEQPNAARVHHQTLLDHLPTFLRTLGEGLSAPLEPDSCPHCVPAAAHGEQRWENGWALPEVVQDYQILRRILLEHLEEVLPRPLGFREAAAIGMALDEAIASSVSAYVRHRDAHVRRLEEEHVRQVREQAEALRDLDRRKNDFLAMLAHELRNPLAPILHSVEVLRLAGPDGPALAQARNVIERQVKQMTRLVDDLLDVARIAQGKLELRRTRFDLAEAVGQAVQTTAPLFEAQQHRLSVRLPAGPLPVEADQARVVQVIVNLLTNAAKYTDRGGEVHLTAGRQDGEVVVRVRDTGAGIEPEMLPRIFDLFTQIDRLLDRSQGGLGIGLTLVRRLVEMHGGRVGVHSRGPGHGSEFTVSFPAANGEPAAGEDPSDPAPAPTGRRVLIVEDSADTRSTLSTLLTLLGHRVEGAASGPEGIERALAWRPEVALIDLGLPGLDGLEVARRMREALGDSVRLVALTGHARDEDRSRTQAAGFDAHLVKPVETDELNRVLALTPGASPSASPPGPPG